jgi:hypothetical protein
MPVAGRREAGQVLQPPRHGDGWPCLICHARDLPQHRRIPPILPRLPGGSCQPRTCLPLSNPQCSGCCMQHRWMRPCPRHCGEWCLLPGARPKFRAGSAVCYTAAISCHVCKPLRDGDLAVPGLFKVRQQQLCITCRPICHDHDFNLPPSAGPI